VVNVDGVGRRGLCGERRRRGTEGLISTRISSGDGKWPTTNHVGHFGCLLPKARIPQRATILIKGIFT